MKCITGNRGDQGSRYRAERYRAIESIRPRARARVHLYRAEVDDLKLMRFPVFSKYEHAMSHHRVPALTCKKSKHNEVSMEFGCTHVTATAGVQ